MRWTCRDLLSDINLFYEVVAIQLTSTVLPVTSVLPDSIVSWIIRGVDYPGHLNDRYTSFAYGPLTEYVQDALDGTNHSKV